MPSLHVSKNVPHLPDMKVCPASPTSSEPTTTDDANGQVEMFLKIFIFSMVLIDIALLWILLNDDNRDDPSNYT